MKRILGLAVLITGVVWLLRKSKFRPLPPAAPPVPPVPRDPPAHELYVADMGGNRILGFEIRSNGTIASTPWRDFGFNQPSSGLQNPFALALTNSNEIWVANLGPSPLQPGNIPSITVYDANASTGAMPNHVILSQPNTPGGTALDSPSAVAWRSNPANLLIVDGSFATVWEVTKADTPLGSVTGFVRPAGIAIDLRNLIYVSDQDPAGDSVWILAMVPNLRGQTATTRITGPATQLNKPAHLAVDTLGRLYVVNRGSLATGDDASITVYAAGATGDAAPIQRILGNQASNTRVRQPYGIAVDTDGRIFVSQPHRVMVFAAGATGNDAPVELLEYPDFGDAMGIAVR